MPRTQALEADYKPPAMEAAPAQIAAERRSLMDRAADLEKQLAAGKDAELEKLKSLVAEFNTIFSETFALVTQPANPKARKCSVCREVGHRAKKCPKAATA